MPHVVEHLILILAASSLIDHTVGCQLAKSSAVIYRPGIDSSVVPLVLHVSLLVDHLRILDALMRKLVSGVRCRLKSGVKPMLSWKCLELLLVLVSVVRAHGWHLLRRRIVLLV